MNVMDTDLQISSAAVTDRGLSDKRPQNEDSYLEMPRSGIFAVADGVGGAQAGEVASQMAMEIIGEAFANMAPGTDAEDVLRTAIGRANTAIHQMAQDLPQLANMASTVVALHLAGNIATIAHVGDSRAYSVTPDGRLVRETDDHSVVEEEVRAGRMTAAQAANHPSKNIISRALGADVTVDIDCRTLMIEPGTVYLLCSDGITRHITDEEIKGTLTFGGEPPDICNYLKGLCYERGAEDNLTAVVVKTGPARNIPNAPEFSIEAVDEVTVATARSPFDSVASESNEDLLELATGELRQAEAEEAQTASEQQQEYVEEAQPIEDAAFSGGAETFSMFGEAKEQEPVEEEPRRGLIMPVVGSLLAGLLLGLGIYHFALVQTPADEPSQPLTEMRSSNIPLSFFEENRRNVDKDPALYIQRAPAPEDAEDQYLIGRAYFLTGDYVKARVSLTAAKEQLNTADATNAAVLAHDIAVLLAVTDNAAVQAALKKEFEATPATPSNANVNR